MERDKTIIVFIFSFISLLLIWEGYEVTKIHGITEGKAITTSYNLFLAFFILGIFLDLMKFGYGITDIKHVPRSITSAALIEENEIVKRQKDYDLGYCNF